LHPECTSGLRWEAAWPCFAGEAAEFAGVDEEGLLAAVAEAAFGVGGFVFREKPEADGNLRAVEELAGEGDPVALHSEDDLQSKGGSRVLVFSGGLWRTGH